MTNRPAPPPPIPIPRSEKYEMGNMERVCIVWVGQTLEGSWQKQVHLLDQKFVEEGEIEFGIVKVLKDRGVKKGKIGLLMVWVFSKLPLFLFMNASCSYVPRTGNA